jgi:hypothetical protein
LALINTLRTNDFQEPEYKKVAQVELEYETSKPKQPDADLHKTYHLTLALIQRLNSLTFRLVKTFTHGISLGSIATDTNVFSYIILLLIYISFSGISINW